MMDDFKDLEYLANKSKELIQKQVDSYRARHTNSSSIITILALFIPFFMSGLDDAHLVVKILALIPIAFLIAAVIYLVQVLRSQPLDQGFNFALIDTLVNKTYEEILLYEIGANKDSFSHNEEITAKSNQKYNVAIKLTLAAIVTSSLLLLGNEISKPKKEPLEISIIKNSTMINSDKDKGGEKKTSETPKVRTIPSVGPQFRVTLNEGNVSKNSPSKKTGDSTGKIK